MDETENHHHLLRPLHPPTTADSGVYTTTTAAEPRNDDSNNFTFRLLFIACIALVSLWATHEASKGFAVTVINDAGDTFAGNRFHLFYISNDQATRLILERSIFTETTLYPTDHLPKKKINRVILRLSSRNLTRPAMTLSGEHDGEFVIHLSPSVMHGPDFKHAMFLAVQRGVARIWVWDGQGNAPISLVHGIVEYITALAVSGGAPPSGAVLPEYSGSGGCWKGGNDPRAVAGFLNYCEGKSEGFVRRLNQEMKNNWHEDMVDDALGDMPAKTLCDSYYYSSREFSASSI